MNAPPSKQPDWLARLLPSQQWVRYRFAIGAAAAARGLRLALTARFGPGLPPYITFYPMVVAVALLAGFGLGWWRPPWRA